MSVYVCKLSNEFRIEADSEEEARMIVIDLLEEKVIDYAFGKDTDYLQVDIDKQKVS